MKNITVETTVQSDLQQIWDMWTKPEHIQEWNHASPDWCCPKAENDVRPDGRFSFTMASKDGLQSFDFNGVYTEVIPLELLNYTIEDGRKVSLRFTPVDDSIHITETFELEEINSEEMQRSGWQAILDNFKKHVESES